MTSEPVAVALPLEEVHVVPADTVGDPIILALKAGPVVAARLSPQEAGNLGLLLLDLVARAPTATDDVLQREPTLAHDLAFEPSASPGHLVLAIDLGHVSARFEVSVESLFASLEQIRPIAGLPPKPN